MPSDDRKSRSTVEALVDTAFERIRALDGAGAGLRLFPAGLGSLELSVRSPSDDDRGYEVSLRLAATGSTQSAESAVALEVDDDVEVSFNAEGHHVVAMIAMADLEARAPATAKAVTDLLAKVNRDLSEAATFPDEIRNSHPETKPFHFVDIPFEKGGPANPPLPAEPHVIAKLVEFRKFVSDGAGTAQERVDALSWVIHLTGDIHQPLHCTEHVTEDHPAGDRGGNSFKLRGKAKNLHSLWDSSVDFASMDEDALVLSIMQDHTRDSLGSDLAKTDVEGWARASFKLAKKYAYSIAENPANPPKPSASYLKQANKIGRRQAALAGYRLADQFASVFGH
jgi:hypothetical protein